MKQTISFLQQESTMKMFGLLKIDKRLTKLIKKKRECTNIKISGLKRMNHTRNLDLDLQISLQNVQALKVNKNILKYYK